MPGMAIMELITKGVTARDIINEKSIRNAIACDMALGCSSNSVLHLLAIAHEAGVTLDLHVFNEISSVTPNLCHLAPAGGTHMHDLDNAGGVPAVMAQLAAKDLIDTTLPTVSGKTVGENIAGRTIRNAGAIRPINEPYSETGGIAILWGNLAKDGCVVKRSAVAPEMLVHTGPARVFDSEEDAIAAIYAGSIKDGEVVVIRYEGPKGGPGMRENGSIRQCAAGHGAGQDRCFDHRWQIQRRQPRRVYRTCQSGGCGRRSDRSGARGRSHRHQYSGVSDQCSCFRCGI